MVHRVYDHDLRGYGLGHDHVHFGVTLALQIQMIIPFVKTYYRLFILIYYNL